MISNFTTTSISSSKPAYYLGLDLTPEAIRGVVLDDSLDVIVADCVFFDNSAGSDTGTPFNLPSSSSPADTNPLLNPSQSPTPVPITSSSSTVATPAPTIPISDILTGLDLLFSKLSRRANLGCVRSICGSTFPSAIFYQSPASGSFSFGDVLNANSGANDHNATLQSLLFPSSFPSSPFFALAETPTLTDTSSTPFAQLLQDTHYVSASNMASRCGTSAFAGPLSGLLAAQMIKLRVTMPEVWKGVGAVSGLGGFLAALLCGGKPRLSVTDALTSGMLDYGSLIMAKGKQECAWDLDTLKFVAGVENENASESEVQRVLEMIGLAGEERDKEGTIANYFVTKYGFSKETTIHTFTSTHVATFLSLVPTTSDSILQFGTQDAMIFSAPGPSPYPSTLTQSFPHPAQTQTQGSDTPREWISVLTSRNGDVPRALVRDMYTKSWSAFDRLVAIVPPGGSIGLDDKLFSFWFVQPEYESGHISPVTTSTSGSVTTKTQAQSQSQPTRGIYRFENGTKVGEFRDLRANPRCLIEGQIMAFRIRYGRVAAASDVGANVNSNANGSILLNGHHQQYHPGTTTTNGHTSVTSSSLPSFSTLRSSLPFDPYTSAPLPKRILAIGSASYFPSIVNVVGEVFNSPVFVPQSVLEEGVVWAELVTALQQGTSSGANGGGEETGNKDRATEGAEGSGVNAATNVSTLSATLARIPSRPAIGTAYLARWWWKYGPGGAALHNSSSSAMAISTTPSASFEDDIRWLLAKRWGQSQSQYQGLGAGFTSGQHQQHQHSSSGLGFGLGLGIGSPSSSFGLATPTSSGPAANSPLSYGHGHLSKTSGRRGLHRAKSNLALASETVVEEDEDHVDADADGMGGGRDTDNDHRGETEGVPRESGVYKYPLPTSSGSGAGVNSSSSLLPMSPIPATFPNSMTTVNSQSNSNLLPSLTVTTTPPSHPHTAQPGPLTSLLGPLPTPAPLTSTLHPISALTTNDADAQFGLVKVAEPDEDAFVCYASMLFEWVRLEGGIWGKVW